MGKTTPEGKVKKRVKEILEAHGCWYHMPVGTERGADTVDFHGARRADGRAFLIETKAPGERPTDRQKKRLRDARSRKVAVFVLDGDDDDMRLFGDWLRHPHTGNAEAAERMIDKWKIDYAGEPLDA